MKRMIFILSVMELFGGVSAFTLEGSMKSMELHYPADSVLITFTNTAGNVFKGISHKDQSGYFSIANIPDQPSTGTLSVTRKGLRPIELFVTDITGIPYFNPLVIPTGTGTAKLTGTVTDRNTSKPVQGAQVILSLAPASTSFQTPYDTAFTAADGSYGFDSLYPPNDGYYDEFAVLVSKPGYEPYVDYAQLPTLRGKVDFKLNPAENKTGTVKGMITGEWGQGPIANAKVILIRNPTLYGTTFLDTMRTDENGGYAFDSIPASSDNKLSVWAPDFASKNSQSFRIDSGSTVTLDMKLTALISPTRISGGSPRFAASKRHRAYRIDGKSLTVIPNAGIKEIGAHLSIRH